MRLRNDNLLPVHVLNSSVPAAVSTAIMRCLNLSVDDRTKTVYTLIDAVSTNFSDVELQIDCLLYTSIC